MFHNGVELESRSGIFLIPPLPAPGIYFQHGLKIKDISPSPTDKVNYVNTVLNTGLSLHSLNIP